jgi:hypothetical protein
MYFCGTWASPARLKDLGSQSGGPAGELSARAAAALQTLSLPKRRPPLRHRRQLPLTVPLVIPPRFLVLSPGLPKQAIRRLSKRPGRTPQSEAPSRNFGTFQAFSGIFDLRGRALEGYFLIARLACLDQFRHQAPDGGGVLELVPAGPDRHVEAVHVGAVVPSGAAGRGRSSRSPRDHRPDRRPQVAGRLKPINQGGRPPACAVHPDRLPSGEADRRSAAVRHVALSSATASART